ncbi:VWA domain-containing protein, partial [Neoroseomonas rubea]|uniref:VWA domain-containing protein n=1 Tax=Neoroseomonas rubea TaxID=2748666 RepID=UPI0018DFA155
MTFAQGSRAALLALLIALLAGTARAQPAILVLDASESMWGEVEARTKIATAQDALAGLMARWPDQRPVGLLAYGHRRAGDCTDVEMLAAPAPDAAAVVAAAARVTPRGRTPIA